MRYTVCVLLLGLALGGCPIGNECDADAGTCEPEENGGSNQGGDGDGDGDGAGGTSGGAGTSGGDGDGDGTGAGGTSGGSAGTGGSSVGGAAGDYIAARDALTSALCECTGEDIDTCTDTTQAQRDCEASAIAEYGSVAGDWIGCVANFFSTQAECISAAACGADLQSCTLFAQSDTDPIEAECGAPPTELADVAGGCEGSVDPGTDPGTGTASCDVPAEWYCDGEQDCADGSDEAGCAGGGVVPADGFQCGDGSTIPTEWVCDGEADCVDASDEQSCL